MFEVDIRGHKLRASETIIEYGASKVDPRRPTAIRWVRKNTYVNGMHVHRVRSIIVRNSEHSITLDCAYATTTPAADEMLFQNAWAAVWRTAGLASAERALSKLYSDGEVEVAGTKLDRSGVWADGRWQFLWWSGKPRLILWNELEVSHSETDLMVRSMVDASKVSMKSFNDVDNASVLDFVLRYALENESTFASP